MRSLRNDFVDQSLQFKAELFRQANNFVLSVSNRWQIVACVLVTLFFLGGGGLSSWIYFNKENGIQKLTTENKEYVKELMYLRQEACQSRKAKISVNYCKKAGLTESTFENPFP